MSEQLIQKLLTKWKRDGEAVSKDGMPMHPEFLFRQSNEWQGWADFLGCESTKSIQQQDDLESKAYSMFMNGLN